MVFFQDRAQLDDKNSKGTRCISLFIHINTAIYFDSFETEYISQDVFKQNQR